jgi:hypothetical protein
MTDDPRPPSPDRDDGPEPDPVEAELVAYLDGELDPSTARDVERKLAGDPKLRARAEALKRSFDLLEFLPKSEPSPTFATRTLDKLPAVSGSQPRPVAAPPHPTTTPIPQPPAGGGSSPVPVVLSSGPPPLTLSGTATIPHPGRPWVWAAGLFAAVGLAIGVGYIGTAAAWSYFRPAQAVKEPTAASLPLADIPVVENLPLYAAVDDLDFLHQLAVPDLFGDELLAADRPAPPRPVEPDKPAGKQLDQLVKVFLALPADRQEMLRLLHRRLQEMEPGRQDRSYRVLESYAAWLNRLPDRDRKAVLTAPTAEKRLEEIREVRNEQWVATLPVARRAQLKGLPRADRAELIARWKGEDGRQRDEWATARSHWDALRTGRQPWPFTDEAMKKEVVAFVHAAYHPDDPTRCRLTTTPVVGDLARLKYALDRAEKNGEWLWLGQAVYNFSKRYEMLPEPAKGKPVAEIADLSPWPAIHKHYENRPKVRQRVDAAAGKWPDFALAVWEDLNRGKFAVAASRVHLGPCRPVEFKDEVRGFLPELEKKLTPAERAALRAAEGKWPDYPRELVRLARAHDMSVPGAMPPGPPGMWEKTYNPPRPALARPRG